jgi:hypothetical protein
MLASTSGLRLASASTTPSASDPFTFDLSGSTAVVWKVDTNKIAGAVAGKTRAAAEPILTGFPEISKAYLTLRPFWRNTFPDDPAEIKVTVRSTPAAK